MATNTNVNKVIYDNSTLIDLTGDTVTAEDVLNSKIFHLPSGAIATGTATGGGGSTYGYEKIGEITFTTSTTSTSTTNIPDGGVYYGDPSVVCTIDKIVYVRIRDTAGKRAGYFYGTDNYFMNYQKANGSTSTLTYAGRFIHRYTSDNKWMTYTVGQSTGYGIFAYGISNDGSIPMYRRYNATYTLTVDGTYKAEIYLLDFPDGITVYV